jgi:hypothetical protein
MVTMKGRRILKVTMPCGCPCRALYDEGDEVDSARRRCPKHKIPWRYVLRRADMDGDGLGVTSVRVEGSTYWTISWKPCEEAEANALAALGLLARPTVYVRPGARVLVVAHPRLGGAGECGQIVGAVFAWGEDGYPRSIRSLSGIVLEGELYPPVMRARVEAELGLPPRSVDDIWSDRADWMEIDGVRYSREEMDAMNAMDAMDPSP